MLTMVPTFALRSRDKSVRFGARLAYDTSSTGRELTILARAQCASPMRIDWFLTSDSAQAILRVSDIASVIDYHRVDGRRVNDMGSVRCAPASVRS